MKKRGQGSRVASVSTSLPILPDPNFFKNPISDANKLPILTSLFAYGTKNPQKNAPPGKDGASSFLYNQSH
jgi:hypothetical protein